MDTESCQTASMPPEVSPADVWGDPAWMEDAPAPAAILPRRAKRPRRRQRDVNGTDSGGLRIGGWTQPRAPLEHGISERIEISEINGNVLRLAPEMPAVERVPRLVKFLPRQPSGRGRKGAETGEWGRAHGHSMIWFFGAGTAVVAMVVGALVMLPRVNRANAVEIGAVGQHLVIDQYDPDATAREIAAMLPRSGEAEALYDAAAATSSVDGLLPMLRDGAKVAPLLRAAGWSKWLPRSRIGNAWSVLEKNGVVFGLLEGTREDYSKFEAYFVDDGGKLRIDWKASTAFGTAMFSELIEGRGDPGEIRGKITPVDFYTMAMPEETYRCFRLVSPDETQALWIYAAHDGDAAASLKEWFDGGQILTGSDEPQKATLRLAPPPEGALPNQWLLVELLHKDWIAP